MNRNRKVTLIAGLAVCSMLLTTRLVAQGCLAPDDTSARIARWVTVLLNDTTARAAAERDTLGITGVQPNQITAITDSRTCAKIVSAFDHYEGVTRSTRKVYAYQVGPTVVAQDPNWTTEQPSSEWSPFLYLDRTFKVIRTHNVF